MAKPWRHQAGIIFQNPALMLTMPAMRFILTPQHPQGCDRMMDIAKHLILFSTRPQTGPDYNLFLWIGLLSFLSFFLKKISVYL